MFALVVLRSLFAHGQSVDFYGRRDYTTRSMPEGIVSGDFNGDMLLDLAVANTQTHSVSIFLGNAQARFTLVDTIPVGMKPKAVIAVDLNGDTTPDLAVANSQSDNVSILIGDGTGRFAARPAVALCQAPSVCQGPEALAAGLFTEDLIPDLVVANGTSNNLSVLQGVGDGTFVPRTLVPVGVRPQALAVGRIGGGIHLDVVVANFGSNSVTILRGRGDGTFQALSPSAVGKGPRGVVLVDFDRDTRMDIAVANYSDKSIALLRGRGDDAFFPPQALALDSRPTALAVADFNNDQRPDLAVTAVEDMDALEMPIVSVFLGRGDLTFQPAYQMVQGCMSYGILAADFHPDDIPDIITTSSGGDTISFWRGAGDGTFVTESLLSAALFPVGVAAGDLNGDQIPELVTANFGDNTISVFGGLGDGTFIGPFHYALGPAGVFLDPTAVGLADFNGDQRLDAVVANAGDHTAAVLLNLGDRFGTAASYTVGADPRSLAVADMDGDRFLDIITANFSGNSVSVLRGRGDGTFLQRVDSPVGAMTNPRALAIKDLNLDGIPDVVTANFGTNNASVLLGTGTGALAPAMHYPTGRGPHGLALDDFNRDDVWDLVVSNALDGTVSILLGSAEWPGTFTPGGTIPVGNGPTGTVAVDLNRDRIPDIVMTNAHSGNVGVLIGRGDGTFSGPEFFGAGAGPIFLAPGDFFVDNIPDLAVVNAYSGTVSILINRTP